MMGHVHGFSSTLGAGHTHGFSEAVSVCTECAGAAEGECEHGVCQDLCP